MARWDAAAGASFVGNRQSAFPATVGHPRLATHRARQRSTDL